MKFQATAMVALGALVANPPAAEAARERMSVEEGGIEFNIDYFDDGRSRPYKLSFSDDSVASTCNFDATGSVTYIRAGSETYRIRYKSNGDLRSVTLTSSRRRNLAAEELDEARVVTEGSVAALAHQTTRKLYACDDCVATWDAICDSGVPSVCALVGYGSPILSEGEATIATICEDLGAACSRSGGEETCEDQCEEDDDTDDRVLNPCLDSTNAEYRCIQDDAASSPNYLDLSTCDLVDADAADMPACFEAFGMTDIHQISLSFTDFLTTLPAGVFMGLSSLVDMDLSYTTIEYLPEGVFAGLSELTKLEIHWSSLASLPEGIFSDTPKMQNLVVSSSQLSSLPAGLFAPLPDLTRLDLRTSSALQCIPSSTATELLVPDDLDDGICVCEPAVAITCEVGTCQPGAEGYTCE